MNQQLHMYYLSSLTYMWVACILLEHNLHTQSQSSVLPDQLFSTIFVFTVLFECLADCNKIGFIVFVTIHGTIGCD